MVALHRFDSGLPPRRIQLEILSSSRHYKSHPSIQTSSVAKSAVEYDGRPRSIQISYTKYGGLCYLVAQRAQSPISCKEVQPCQHRGPVVRKSASSVEFKGRTASTYCISLQTQW